MECGLGFDPAQSPAEELAGRILKWIGKKEYRSVAFRKALAARARKFFSIERYATENLLAYEEVLEEDGVRDGDDQGVVFPAFDVGFLGEHVADDVLPPFLEEEELEAVISENFLAGEGVGEDLVDAGHDFISFAFVFMVFFHDALLR